MSEVQEYNQFLIINPSFTGTTFGKRIYSDILFSRSSLTKTYTKILSSDFFIPTKKIGIGVYGGTRNNGSDKTFTLWGEGSFSKFKKMKGRKFLIPAASIGIDQTIEDIGLKIQRRLFPSSTHRAGSQKDSMVNMGTRLYLKSGIILANHEWNTGLSGMINGKINLGKTDEEDLQTPNSPISNNNRENDEGLDLKFRMVAHWMKTYSYHHRGLLSQKYYLQPRIIMDYSSERTQLYSDIKIQRFRWNGGIGLIHNLTNNKSRAVLMGGYDLNHFKLNYLISGGFTENDQFVVVHGLNIKVVIPELGGTRNKPLTPLIRDI